MAALSSESQLPISRFLTAMKIFGVYSDSQQVCDLNMIRKSIRDRMRQIPFWQCAVGTIVALNFVRLLPAFCHQTDGFSEKLFLTTVVTIWYFQCSYNVVWFLWCCCKKDKFCQLQRQFSDYIKSEHHLNLSTLRRYSILLTVSSIFFIICNIGLISYILFSGSQSMIDFKSLLITPFGVQHILLDTVLVILQVICAGSWIFPLFFYILQCITLGYLFKTLTEEIRSMNFCESTRDCFHQVCRLRLQHVKLCDIVESMDDCFGIFTAFGLGTALPMSCFVLYMMLWPKNSSDYMIIFNCFLLCINGFHIILITVFAAHVNVQVRNTEVYKNSTVGSSLMNYLWADSLLSFMAGLCIWKWWLSVD